MTNTTTRTKTKEHLRANFQSNEIEAMEPRYRINFINSLSGYKSANLIGSVSETNISNLAIFSSVVHLGADPALVGFINRPHTVERQTLENILATGSYTINHVNQAIYKQSHHTAARYAANVSEFEKAGLGEQWTEHPAPYVAESLIKFGVELVNTVTIAENKTVLVVGRICEVFCDPALIEADGKVSIDQVNSVAVSGLDEYFTGNKLARLPYAKPRP